MMNKIAIRRARSCDDSRNKGFSLVELIIVIAIMAVLTAILAPQLLRYVERAREARDKHNLSMFLRTMQMACVDYSTSDARGGEVIYARNGGGATYTVDGTYGSLNPSLIDMMLAAFGPERAGASKGEYYEGLPPLVSRKFRTYNNGNGVQFNFVILNADGTTTKIDNPGNSNGAPLTVQYKGPSLT